MASHYAALTNSEDGGWPWLYSYSGMASYPEQYQIKQIDTDYIDLLV